jgi:pilus assembly protein TadC
MEIMRIELLKMKLIGVINKIRFTNWMKIRKNLIEVEKEY